MNNITAIVLILALMFFGVIAFGFLSLLDKPPEKINIAWKTFSQTAENESDCFAISKTAWFNVCPELKGNLNCSAIFESIKISYNSDTKLCYLEIPVGGLNG